MTDSRILESRNKKRVGRRPPILEWTNKKKLRENRKSIGLLKKALLTVDKGSTKTSLINMSSIHSEEDAPPKEVYSTDTPRSDLPRSKWERATYREREQKKITRDQGHHLLLPSRDIGHPTAWFLMENIQANNADVLVHNADLLFGRNVRMAFLARTRKVDCTPSRARGQGRQCRQCRFRRWKILWLGQCRWTNYFPRVLGTPPSWGESTIHLSV